MQDLKIKNFGCNLGVTEWVNFCVFTNVKERRTRDIKTIICLDMSALVGATLKNYCNWMVSGTIQKKNN
jgi:hypothetical protein